MGARRWSPGAAGRARRLASRRGAAGVGAGAEGDAVASPGGPGDRAGGVGRGATRTPTPAGLPAPLPPLEEVSRAGLLRGGRRAAERRFAGGSLWGPRSLSTAAWRSGRGGRLLTLNSSPGQLGPVWAPWSPSGRLSSQLAAERRGLETPAVGSPGARWARALPWRVAPRVSGKTHARVDGAAPCGAHGWSPTPRLSKGWCNDLGSSPPLC